MEKNFHRLAKGLNAIGEIREGNEKDVSASGRWEEASFTMQADMDNIQSSMDLEKCFHGVVHDALRILGKEAFVLALDDIDTRPSIGWHVLEVIRRYLTTPQILIIMSGDLDLLTSIIRREHANGLGIEVTASYAQKAPYKERLDGLTEQYLLKILRANARINLGNFISAMQANGLNVLRESDTSKVMIKNSNYKGIQYTLQELLDSFFDFIGCNAQQERALFRHTLLNTSCRTEVQVLSALFEYKNNKENGNELAFRLCEIYFMQLTNFGLNPLDIQEILQSPQGLMRIMDVLFKAGYAAEGLELLPDRMSSYDNEALLVLHANLAQAMKTDKKLAFAYMFKACWLREVMRYRGETSSEDYKEIAKYVKLYSSTSLTYTAKNIASILWPDIASISTRLTTLGTIRLYRDFTTISVRNMHLTPSEGYYIQKTPIELYPFCDEMRESNLPENEKFINTPKTLHKNIISWHKKLIPLGLLSIRKSNSTYTIFSITALISIISDILNLDTDFDEKDLEALFSKYQNSEEFPLYNNTIPDQGGKSNNSEDDNETTLFNEQTENNTNPDIIKETFLNLMRSWIVKVIPSIHTPTPLLLSRIMQRFSKVLKGIDSTPHVKVFLGKYIHRCLVAFFNSILVEEILLEKSCKTISRQIHLDNPITSDSIFIDNHNKIETLSEKVCPLYRAIFLCPLWGFYLEQDEKGIWSKYNKPYKDIKNSHSLWAIKYKNKELAFHNLYPILNTVAIARNIDSSKIIKEKKNKKATKKENKINSKQIDMRTQIGKDAGVPNRKFAYNSNHKVSTMLKYYHDRNNSAWKNLSENEMPKDFVEFFNDMVTECYTEFFDKERQMKVVWKIICKPKG